MRRNTSVLGAASMRRPLSHHQPVEALQRLARWPTAGRRALPDFLIIGAQKAGTTSLFDYLEATPSVRPALAKEVHYFDRNGHRSPNWYRANFPLATFPRDWVTGESSPYYLLHPGIPSRVVDLVPHVRLIVMLRHPVDRAYSHFQHSRAYGMEPVDDFQEALALEGLRTDEGWSRLEGGAYRDDRVEWFSYARRSVYMPQLRRWLKYFPPEAVAVFTMEEMAHQPRKVISSALAHIGVDESFASMDFPIRNAREYESLDPEVRRAILPRFEEDVREVEEFLGRSTGWTAPTAP
jgi:hypothetical protein